MASQTSELLTLQQAAEWLNVHYMTAYRWVRRGDLPAFKTGGRLRVRVADLERFLAERELDLALGDRPTSATDWARHRERLRALLLSGDEGQARNEVQKVISDGAIAGDVYVHLLTPVLHDIGALWADGEIGVAEEHRASQICTKIVTQLSDLFRRRGPDRGAAAVLTPPDDQHAIASAMVADYLRASGYTVHHLGANVPARDLAMFLAVVPVDLVCFSITSPLPTEQYASIATASREANPDTVLVLGGQGVDVDAAAAVDALVIADLTDLARTIEDL
ncbi:HTH-type transcriptional repressor CarH [soil metagenome]